MTIESHKQRLRGHDEDTLCMMKCEEARDARLRPASVHDASRSCVSLAYD
jgi:hypothetical protein